MNLPYGWTEQYAMRVLLDEHGRMKDEIHALTERLASLEAEITRLDMVKANKPGRKPKLD